MNNYLKHFATIGMGTLINMVIGVITTPMITRLVAPTEYGQMSVFNMYANIAVMILCLGLDQALIRHYYEQDSVEYRRALLAKCVILPIVLTSLVSVAVVVASAKGWIRFEFTTGMMALLCIYILVEVILRFSYLLIRLAHNSRLYARLGNVKRVFYVALAVGLLTLVDGYRVEILTGTTTASAVLILALSIVNQGKLWRLDKSDRSLCHVSQKELLIYAYPYIFSMGITTLFQATGKMALNQYYGYEEIGIYSSTMSLVHIFAIIQSSFNALYAPMAVEHYTKDKMDTSFYQKANHIMTVLMFLMGITLILCKDVFALLLGEKYRASAMILPFAIFNPIMLTISETTVQGIVFMKKSKMQVVVAAIACVTSIVSNRILVPEYGSKGAAISMAIAYTVFFTARTFISNRYYKVDFQLHKFYLLTAVVACYALYNTFIGKLASSVIGYVVCVAAILILYKDTVVFILEYAGSMRLKLRKKG